MRSLEKYLLPFVGVLLIFGPLYKDFTGTGYPGIGLAQSLLILAGVAAIAAGLWFGIKPVSWLITTPVKDIARVALITIVLFTAVDLILGRIVPKVRTPTKYGWDFLPKKESKVIQDTKANYRRVSIEYFDYGFKRWPTTKNKPKVLIIGDSFTAMPFVSNGEEWYSYLERAYQNVQFYVFGGFGYGTLQEYMVLDDRLDDINPDAVIWQFCSNDYENNFYELDRKKYPLNNHGFRPYLEDDEIVYRLPLPLETLREISYVADRLLLQYDRARKRDAWQELREKNKNQFDIDENKQETYKDEAVATTIKLMKKVKSRIGEKPVYFFNACGVFTADDEAVCKSAGLTCIDNIGGKINDLENAGLQLKVKNDGHWNFLGNKYAGQMLVDFFNESGGIFRP